MERGASGVLLIVIGVAACGTRATPIAADGRADGPAACVPTTMAPGRGTCPVWRAAGPAVAVSADGDGVESWATVDIDCGVLVAWSSPAPGGSSSTWHTRPVSFDGSPRSGPVDHPGLTSVPQGPRVVSLARNGTSLAALVADPDGCHFVPLRTDGSEAGAAGEAGAGWCTGLAAESDGFSFLRAVNSGVTPVWLHRVDAGGVPREQRTLDTATGRALWSRLVLDDGSFLLDTFAEDATTTIYTDWVQHFDGRGQVLASESVVPGADTAPVHLASSKSGVLAAWTWSGVELVPLDRDGRGLGLHTTLPVKTALYGLGLAPVPDGDVMGLWLALGANSRLELYVQALAPSGGPRGPETLLAVTSDSSGWLMAVAEPSGERALLVFRDSSLRALPLTCAR
jgi:hypothetical protein